MIDNIIELLDLKDSRNNSDDLIVESIQIEDNHKVIILSKKLTKTYCPHCCQIMHSKGIYTRTIKHPIIQDGFNLILKIKQRKWKCTNTLCNYYCNEEFNIVEKNKQHTAITPLLIVHELKNLNLSLSDVAKKFNVSDTTVSTLFQRYVSIERLPLPRYLSVDEVCLDIDNQSKYCLVLMDFETSEIVDILPNRLDKTTQSYFLNIPVEERNKVEYLICDMYNPYINYTKRYFKRSKCIIDSFHVIQYLIHELNRYIISVKKKYQAKENKALQEANYLNNVNYKTRKLSKELIILNGYKWVLLKNQEDINYTTYRYLNKKLDMYLDTATIEKEFFKLDSHFENLRDLKELYIEFNHRNLNNPENARIELLDLIQQYKNSNESIFNRFSDLLTSNIEGIVNSFNGIPDSFTDEQGNINDMVRRFSNGPMESFNRKPKDLKRLTRGLSNFNIVRNRILWATRKNAKILVIPKSIKEIKVNTGVKRGSYKKQKKNTKK